jgi:16S rRNA (uracil1498-N3)-methyltransferase
LTLGADARPHVFVEDLEAPTLTADDRRHLERSLRVRPGDEITISDGADRWRAAVMGDGVEPVGEIQVVPRSEPTITVGISLLKGRKLDLVVQKLTELGVDRIQLVEAERCVTRWSAGKGDRVLDRFVRVAREAAMQSRRCRLPVIDAPVAAPTLLRDAGVAVAHMDGGAIALDRPTILIGPEGGWSDDELVAADHQVALGPHVLRAETAAIAAGALLGALRIGAV